MMKKFYIKVLTPVHIGCDEVYEPMSFVLDEARRKLVVFDPLEFFHGLTPDDQSRLMEISKKGTVESLLELMKFMRGKRAKGFEVTVSGGFVNHYKQCLEMGTTDVETIQQELNRFEIKRTSFNPYTNQPYLPGSSIKGSIRTAYLNLMAKKKPHVKSMPQEKGAHKQLERDLLDYDRIEEDPFGLLQVSDFMPVKASTRVVYAVNEKKSGGENARGPSQILEVIEPGSWFVGTISVIEDRSKRPLVKHGLTLNGLLESLKFYKKEKAREEEELQMAGINKCVLALDGGHLMRIGHHSGAESVTIEGHRSILIRGKKSYFLDKSTTFWLASDFNKGYNKNKIQPFGWVLLAEASAEREKELEKIVESTSSDDKAEEVAPAEPVVERAPTLSPTTEEWIQADITWNPGKQEITASFEGKRATIRGKEKVPESLHKRLFEKRVSVKAKVVVEKVSNKYTIVKIEG